MKTGQWVRVGEVGVDAGCIMLVDPCYTRIGTTEEPNETWERWYQTQIVDRCYEGNGAHAVDNPGGNFEAGVVVDSGWGDGVYPVEVRYEDGRVAEVRVRFIYDEED